MQVRLLLGPAGSGKTSRCLAEIRAALRVAAEGPPLLFLAPKQATFQLERQLLADPGLAGVLGTVAWRAVCGTDGRRTSSAAVSGVRVGCE